MINSTNYVRIELGNEWNRGISGNKGNRGDNGNINLPCFFCPKYPFVFQILNND